MNLPRRLGAMLGALMALAFALAPRLALAQTGAQVLPGGCGSGGYSGAASVRPMTQDTAGHLCTNAASTAASLTPTGFQQVASFSTSTGFTPPAGSTVCFIQAEGNSVRVRDDGVAPTATIGQLLATGVLLTQTAALSAFRAIPTTGNATLDVACYK